MLVGFTGPRCEIWQDSADPLLAKLRDRRRNLILDPCGGSFRVRAVLGTGDPWAPGPACYLTAEEIGFL